MDISIVEEEAEASHSKPKDSMMAISDKIRFYQTYRRQTFSLPDSIMYYIAKNPKSPQCYQKLIQTCKYFFITNPIIVFSELYCNDFDGWETWSRKNRAYIPLNNVTSKFWITDTVITPVNCSNKNLVSSVIPKFYQCDAKQVSITNQILLYDHFMVLVSAGIILNLNNVIVKDNNNGSIVAFEKLVEGLPNAKTIRFVVPSSAPSTISSRTFKELTKIPHFSKLDRLCCSNITDDFDIESFYTYMKKNKQTKLCIHFFKSVSEAYKNRLETIIDGILEDKNRDYRFPMISYPGDDPEKFSKMVRFFCRD